MARVMPATQGCPPTISRRHLSTRPNFAMSCAPGGGLAGAGGIKGTTCGSVGAPKKAEPINDGVENIILCCICACCICACCICACKISCCCCCCRSMLYCVRRCCSGWKARGRSSSSSSTSTCPSCDCEEAKRETRRPSGLSSSSSPSSSPSSTAPLSAVEADGGSASSGGTSSSLDLVRSCDNGFS